MFKYQHEIDKLLKLGLKMPNLYSPNNLMAYRFIFKDDDENNHKPVCIQNPNRVLPDDLKFSGYALSCYDNEEKANARYFELCKTFKKVKFTIGDSLCGGIITNDDGKISEIDTKTRHFDLYEYSNCNLSNTFTIKRLY